jgi:hypothetical protein
MEEFFIQIRDKYFPELRDAQVKLIFDTKKRMSGGQIRLARIILVDELTQFLTKTEEYDGFDYLLVMDRICWDNCKPIDRERIIRHELRHTVVTPDKSKMYGLRDHTITDFYEEVALNSEDPQWRGRLADMTVEIYQQMKDDAKD